MFLFYCLYMHILMSDLKAHSSLCCNVWCFPTLNKAYCIVLCAIKETGGTSQLLSLDQSNVNASTPSVNGSLNFELNHVNFVILPLVKRSIVKVPKLYWSNEQFYPSPTSRQNRKFDYIRPLRYSHF